MEVFRVTVAVDGRDLEMIVKAGVVATIETGSYEDEIEKPESKVSIIVGNGRQGLSAWVQVAQFEDGRAARISHEGWVQEGQGQIMALLDSAPAAASLSRVSNPSEEMSRCHDNVDFGTFACCTGRGRRGSRVCYVRCCNSCCSDPRRCPGARCCP